MVSRAMALKRRVSAPGCDDAPVVTVETGEAKPVTFVYPYYENRTFFSRQAEHWNAYPEDLRKHLQVIVVDDGSPEPAQKPETLFPLSLYRITVDVRWNWIAARNLAMFMADGWCALTDMDHMIPVETLHSLVHGKHDRNTIYRFSRVEHDGTKLLPHPNSWFMTVQMFWWIGGYDEAFSGHYGTDGEYRRRCAATAPVRILTDRLVRYEHIGDSSTVKYKRKQPEDKAVGRIIAARKENWKPKVLSFPWVKVC